MTTAAPIRPGGSLPRRLFASLICPPAGASLAEDQVSVIKQANDIVEVIGEFIPLRKTGSTYKGLCPFHDDHTPSLDVDPKRQRFRCWACGKAGDVFTFLMEREKVDFREALELLARRANIPLRRGRGAADGQSRAQMLDLMKWAEERYHRNLLASAGGAEARQYLSSRRLSEETIRTYALGYAPAAWDWLAKEAQKAGWTQELLIRVGLVAPREQGNTCYDRFRDRVIFPIRDVRGRTVGFGGRVLPSSSSSAAGPKYYNSSDTPLFSKSENLYGLDRAREAAEKAGYLAVVEGYTDVLMAHQLGILPVVATLGTALNARHIKLLRRYVPRVILVYDADAGGSRGVNQALEVFVGQDVDLSVAALPAGLDPCDLLVEQGPTAFQAALDGAVDALEFKLNQVLTPERMASIDGRRRAMDEVLEVLALAPTLAGQAGLVKRELMISRIAQRGGVKPEVVWARLKELQAARPTSKTESAAPQAVNLAALDPAERQLLAVLLAQPGLVAAVRPRIEPARIEHAQLRKLLEVVYGLDAAGQSADLDCVREKLAEDTELCSLAVQLQERGLAGSNHASWLEELIKIFEDRAAGTAVAQVRNELRKLPASGPPPVELLRKLQETRKGNG